MTVAFGAVAIFVSLALGWRILGTGITPATIPALVMVLLIDLVPIGFAMLLRRTYTLALTGQFATGIVVAAKVRGITSWGLVYDFLDGSGQVVRGRSLRSFYTVALARAFHAGSTEDYFGIGSYVPVVYRAEDPSRNAAFVSFPWAI